jgi:hypothetical protein
VDALPFFLPADSLTPGVNFAHAARWPAVAKRPMSTPISEMITRGDPADAADLIQPLHRVGERGDQLLKLAVQLGDVGVQQVRPGSILASRYP